MGDKIVCFHTLLKVLILRGVAGGFSISADSKALAEMERAVSPLLTNTVDQFGCPLCTLNYYTMLFIFVKRKSAACGCGVDERRAVCGSRRRKTRRPAGSYDLPLRRLPPPFAIQIPQHGISQQGICAGLIAPALTPQPGDNIGVKTKSELLL
jgi:hypothetical protein